MGGYVLDRAALLVKKEDSSGTYVDADFVLPVNRGAGVLEVKFDKEEVDPMSSSLGSKYNIVNTIFAQVPLEVKFNLPSDKNLVDTLFRGCGVVGSDVDDGVEYKYDSSNMDTLSFKQIALRELTKAKGARGDLTITAEAGKAVEVSFNFESFLEEQTKSGSDNSVPESPIFEPVFMSNECNAYLVNGNSASFSKIEFKLNADTVAPKESCSGGCYTKDIKPELSVEMSDSLDNANSFDDLKNGTEFNFVLPFFDLQGNKKWEIISPKCVVIEHKKPESEGRITVNRTLECRKVNGDDNFILKYYS